MQEEAEKEHGAMIHLKFEVRKTRSVSCDKHKYVQSWRAREKAKSYHIIDLATPISFDIEHSSTEESPQLYREDQFSRQQRRA